MPNGRNAAEPKKLLHVTISRSTVNCGMLTSSPDKFKTEDLVRNQLSSLYTVTLKMGDCGYQISFQKLDAAINKHY